MPTDSSRSSDARVIHDLPTTHWSVVLAAGDVKHERSGVALATLCEAYWFPLYSYVRRRVTDVDEAQELTQEFFAELLEKNTVGTADPARGRFRAFLLTAFKHFLTKQWEKGRAKKRGGGQMPRSLDFQTADSTLRIEPAGGLTAEQLFDQQWAITLLDRIMTRLAAELEAREKSEQFEALKVFIIGDHPGIAYAEVALKLGTTEAAAKQTASRMRRRYRELLREEVAQTVANVDEVENEIANLFHVLSL